MKDVYKKIFPQVNRELNYWKQRANEIPDEELKTQALASIQDKKFHCQGGSVYSLLAGDEWKEAIRFIVAYQTISDYLDNLCDRSTSLDPTDFRMLHQSMEDALTPENEIKNYYQYRVEQADGEYLTDLVKTCQQVLSKVNNYSLFQSRMVQLESMYSDLQVHKHVAHEQRIPRLEKWFDQYQEQWPMLSWYEFSACAGSTLGIFCMVSYGLGNHMTEELAEKIFDSYFPFLQGLHIMLDYFIDQAEDEEEGDLNFCTYYRDHHELEQRLVYFVEKTNEYIQTLPDKAFHEMIQHGLVGLYLADPKVKRMKKFETIVKRLIKVSGRKSQFFHWNIKIYNRLAGRY
ncbi:tetraprenyl-beta-curcumene synthase family protein [Gracilibacillus sp. S3-1-1]|uniref:Tetraprenyl-beta-curcumene synthase family protein n=2 Tax=Gracilibacillus pellucidus TaxID=3095368 RepID=A0ACC6M1H5_9BACI|nr:tetraprenyl-beta-curcumene synthase family protein [Gracilibacillus sp. S3-1-1]MDX8044803.1 tetraprenyl-beta-curcumene synthase family protein [Gracilibacillus sp. S3-1-1]